ncbi:hypothetical protein VTK56DRAFT_9424 [Thermocarpiscus australiensis]
MAGQEGEWVQVKGKGGRQRKVPTPASVVSQSMLDGIRPNPNPELSVDDLWRYHEAMIQEFHALKLLGEVRQVLEAALSRSNRPAITKAICLGPGTYEPSNGSSTARRTAHMQTAVFRSIIDHLSSQRDQEIKCVIQEPMFTHIDREFCAKLGLEAVESPEAFAMVDDSTLLFGIHLELPIYSRALANLPAIYIGASLKQWEDTGHDPEAEGPMTPFSVMDATYDSYDFPDLDCMFYKTVVYWRRGKRT